MSAQPQESFREAGRRVAGLFDEHGRLVLGICRLTLGDPGEAEDAAQQAFVSAYRALLRGTEPRDDAAWLATIARNECRQRLRRQALVPVPAEPHELEAPASADPAAVAAFHAELGELRAAIAELPERQREALLLRDLYGLAYEDVAAAMSVTEASVESLLVRARRALQASLHEAPSLAGALAVPATLRDGIAAAVPGFGFGAAEVGVPAAAAGGAFGVLGKLATLPFGAKVAAATVATVAVGAGVGQRAALDREPEVAVPIEANADAATLPARERGASGGRAAGAAAQPRHRRADRAPGRASRQSSTGKGDAPRDPPDTSSRTGPPATANPRSGRDSGRDSGPPPPPPPASPPASPPARQAAPAPPPTVAPRTDSSGPGSGSPDSGSTSGSESGSSDSGSGSGSSGSDSSGSGSSGSGSDHGDRDGSPDASSGGDGSLG